MSNSECEWFAEWFDTPYYHLLYHNRDQGEARTFIQNLVGQLPIQKGDSVLDLACGKGRHTRILAELGFQVTGADLSANSIKEAQQTMVNGTQFIVHDMRYPIPNRSFQCVFNLFTSFGYFDSLEDNRSVISSVREMLEPHGHFVIDFMNSCFVIDHLVSEETKTMGGIDFHIHRTFDDQHILKDIRFVDKGKNFHYEERVQALTLDDFQEMLEDNGFQILRTFGNFNLASFDRQHSDRLIIIAQKKSWNSSSH